MNKSHDKFCYHGTGKQLYEQKKSNYFKIINYNVIIEASKHSTKYKVPGSLGYGIYTYTANDMAYEMADKFYEDPIVVEVELDLKNDEILDLNDDETSVAFHVFRKKALQTARLHRKKFKVPNNKQNVLDGIVIELFIKNIKAKQHNVKVSAVKLKTFAPILEERPDEYSNVHNGNEVCLRDSSVIKSIELKE